MNELEKKIFNALVEFPRKNTGIEKDCARHIAKIALEEIKAAHREGYLYRDRIKSARPIDEYLKQKGYE